MEWTEHGETNAATVVDNNGKKILVHNIMVGFIRFDLRRLGTLSPVFLGGTSESVMSVVSKDDKLDGDSFKLLHEEMFNVVLLPLCCYIYLRT